jgi:hypothetical protein
LSNLGVLNSHDEFFTGGSCNRAISNSVILSTGAFVNFGWISLQASILVESFCNLFSSLFGTGCNSLMEMPLVVVSDSESGSSSNCIVVLINTYLIQKNV